MNRPAAIGPQGFSLIEAVLTTFLVGLFLGVLANLTGTLRTVTRLSNEKAASAEVRTLLGVLRGELTEAIEVTQPASSGKVAKVELRRIKPEMLSPNTITPTRLELPPTQNVSYYWNPIDPNYVDAILYDVSDKVLQRKLGTAAAVPIATVEKLQASQPRAGLIVVSIEVKSTQGPEILKCVVDRS